MVYGSREFTVDAGWAGKGARVPKSQNLRDTENGVLTCLHIAEGEHKTVEREGVTVLILPGLIEWKLVYGMSGTCRLKDLTDVQELVKVLQLSSEYQDQLTHGIRAKYMEL